MCRIFACCCAHCFALYFIVSRVTLKYVTSHVTSRSRKRTRVAVQACPRIVPFSFPLVASFIALPPVGSASTTTAGRTVQDKRDETQDSRRNAGGIRVSVRYSTTLQLFTPTWKNCRVSSCGKAQVIALHRYDNQYSLIGVYVYTCVYVCVCVCVRL